MLNNLYKVDTFAWQIQSQFSFVKKLRKFIIARLSLCKLECSLNVVFGFLQNVVVFSL